MKTLINHILWALKPIIEWIDKTFTWSIAIKKVTGDQYYLWRDFISPGTVFLANTRGVGSNIINPSKIKHGAIYFGKNLKSTIEVLIKELVFAAKNNPDRLKDADRLQQFIIKNNISDDICYVIEANRHGVVATNLVKFLTTKDRVLIVEPRFGNPSKRHDIAKNASFELGKPYDYGFSNDEKALYCFELVAKAYKKVYPSIEFEKDKFKIFGETIYECYASRTFLEKVHWCVVIDSAK